VIDKQDFFEMEGSYHCFSRQWLNAGSFPRHATIETRHINYNKYQLRQILATQNPKPQPYLKEKERELLLLEKFLDLEDFV